ATGSRPRAGTTRRRRFMVGSPGPRAPAGMVGSRARRIVGVVDEIPSRQTPPPVAPRQPTARGGQGRHETPPMPGMLRRAARPVNDSWQDVEAGGGAVALAEFRRGHGAAQVGGITHLEVRT